MTALTYIMVILGAATAAHWFGIVLDKLEGRK